VEFIFVCNSVDFLIYDVFFMCMTKQLAFSFMPPISRERERLLEQEAGLRGYNRPLRCVTRDGDVGGLVYAQVGVTPGIC